MLIQISSGQGPEECELAVQLFLTMLEKSYKIQKLELIKGINPNTLKSALISCEDSLSFFLGSVQWICQSPYRPTHKRKNWFIDVSLVIEKEKILFDKEKVRFETFRSGGKGGQNVNKVETGVRAIYSPLGLAVVSTKERSQYANKMDAARRLKEKIEAQWETEKNFLENNRWERHTKIKRGDAIAVFQGMDFHLVKVKKSF